MKGKYAFSEGLFMTMVFCTTPSGTPSLFLSSRVLPPGAAAVEEYYEREQVWPAQSLARRQKLLPAIEAWQATLK